MARGSQWEWRERRWIGLGYSVLSVVFGFCGLFFDIVFVNGL